MTSNIVIRRRYLQESDSNEYSLVDMEPPSDHSVNNGINLFPPTANYGDIFMVCDPAYVADMENHCNEFYVCCKDGETRLCNRNKWIYEWETDEASPAKMVRRFSEYARGYTTIAKAINACCRFALNRVSDESEDKDILIEAMEWSEDNVGGHLADEKIKDDFYRIQASLHSQFYHDSGYIASASRAIAGAMLVSVQEDSVGESNECINRILRGSNLSDEPIDRITLARIIRSFIPLSKMLLVDVLEEME